MDIKDRMETFRLENAMTVLAFEKLCGFSNGSWAKAQEIKESSIVKFVQAFPYVNANWLLTGNGEMMLDCGRNGTGRDGMEYTQPHIDLDKLCNDIIDNYSQRQSIIRQLAAAAADKQIHGRQDTTKSRTKNGQTTPKTNNRSHGK